MSIIGILIGNKLKGASQTDIAEYQKLHVRPESEKDSAKDQATFKLTYVYLDISQQRSDATVDTEDDDQFSVATNAATYLGRQKDTTAITMIVANNTSVASFKNSSPKSRVRNKRKKTKKWRQLRMLRRRSKRSRH